MTKQPKLDLATQILRYCRSRTGHPLTKLDVASALGRRLPNRKFDGDLARARHMALDRGEELTNCAYDPDSKTYVMFHLRARAEGGKALPPLLVAHRAARTRVRNVGRHGSWLAKNGRTKSDRDFGEVFAAYAEVGEAALRAAEVVAKVLREPR